MHNNFVRQHILSKRLHDCLFRRNAAWRLADRAFRFVSEYSAFLPGSLSCDVAKQFAYFESKWNNSLLFFVAGPGFIFTSCPRTSASSPVPVSEIVNASHGTRSPRCGQCGQSEYSALVSISAVTSFPSSRNWRFSAGGRRTASSLLAAGISSFTAAKGKQRRWDVSDTEWRRNLEVDAEPVRQGDDYVVARCLGRCILPLVPLSTYGGRPEPLQPESAVQTLPPYEACFFAMQEQRSVKAGVPHMNFRVKCRGEASVAWAGSARRFLSGYDARRGYTLPNRGANLCWAAV